ncbi:MAG TPA: hypothetical protein VGR90_11440 [Acidimicrobiales bacterium]|nr:hypothetical protein [Acidimicrobiales bacterium]
MTTTEHASGTTRRETAAHSRARISPPAGKRGPGKPGRGREVQTPCPDCGQVLLRPADFSAERLLYLHRKWGACIA